jgi:hypothetical protein
VLSTVITATADIAPPVLGSDAWWSQFLTSPGFAGTAAVLGAALAFTSVLVNNRSNRKARVRDRWWEMYQAVASDLSSYTVRRATMVLAALDAEAATKFERQLVAVLIDELLPEGGHVTVEGGETVG